MPAIKVLKDKCKGCELCCTACPQQILSLSDSINSSGFRFAVVNDPHRCIGCAICAVSCPDLAIEVYAEGTVYRFYGARARNKVQPDNVKPDNYMKEGV
ncbi:MAG: 4Fe-4S dicluster domain-containing protein [Deltaproteobacteria bacterium]|nr:4Fe-4S dicluster domain-containing protein [Deltaproteobacteria bacterium]